MIYFVLAESIQVCAITLIYLITRPLLRKYSGVGVMFFLSMTVFVIMVYNSPFYLGKSLITLPWQVPHVSSPVAALDYTGYSSAWPTVINKVWQLGMFAYLALGAGIYIWLRVKVRRTSRPASARVEIIAREVYQDIQENILKEKQKKNGAAPTEAQLETIRRRKPPKLLVTSAVSSPASIVIFPCRVLLDSENYTNEQLRAIFRHEYAHTSGSCHLRLLSYLGMAVGWFNPAMWYMRGEARRMEEIACDINATRGKTDAEKREYAELLMKLAAKHRELPGTANAGGGVLKDRLTELYRDRKRVIAGGVAGAILCFALYFGHTYIAYPMTYYQASEQSIPAMLGAHEKALVYEGLSLEYMKNNLMPYNADYTLYGAVGACYSADDRGIIYEVAFQYDAAADPEAVKRGVSALESYLTDRLGAPKSALPIVSQYDEALSWDVCAKSGESASITLVKYKGGSYWTDETSGGMLIKLYWNETALALAKSSQPMN